MTNVSAKWFPRRIGMVAGLLALAALPAVGLGAFAAAETGSGEASPQAAPASHQELSDTLEQCLAGKGVTLPARPANGERPTPLTSDQRAAFHAAAEACGITFPARGPRFQLSDTLKQCLAGKGVTLPARPANGERPTPLTSDQRAAFHAAAEACGITFPARGRLGQGQGGTSI